jgi:RNA recognition motif-containing protein
VNESKDKDRKWLHALSLEPIIHMSDTEVAEIPTGSTDCPYVIVGKKKPRLPVGPPPESVKKVKTNDGEGGSGRFASIDANNVSSGALFFGKMGVARPQSVGRELPVAGGGMQNSTSNSHTQTLFVGGIDREVTNSELLRKLPGSVSVSRPLGKNFAFIDFSTPAAAQALMASSKKQSVMIGRRAVDLGWAKPRQSGNEQTLAGETEPETKIELDPPSLDATKLYIGGLPLVYFQVSSCLLTDISNKTIN